MKYSILIIFLLASPLFSGAQTISDVRFESKGEQIEVTYFIMGYKPGQQFNISLSVSTDGGRTWEGPLSKVSGDVGLLTDPAGRKRIIWDVYKEMPDLGGQVVFDVTAGVVEKTTQKIKEKKVKPESAGFKIYTGYNGSLTAPIGLTLGGFDKAGFYFTGRTNTGLFRGVQSSGTYSNGEVENVSADYFTFEDAVLESRVSLLAGLQIRTGRHLSIYGGLGWARYNLYWQISKFSYSTTQSQGTEWVKNLDESFDSVEAELGMMLDFGHFFVGAGITSPGFRWVDVSWSVGVCF